MLSSAFLSKYKSPSHPQLPPFIIWSEAEKKSLTEIPLEPHYQEMLMKLTTVMNEWVHNHEQGWYHVMKQCIPESDTNIKSGLDRYLETANKLQKPKNGHTEYFRLPATQRDFECTVNVYQTFWRHACYAALHKELFQISCMTAEELTQDSKGKIYAYALTKFKEQEVPNLELEEKDKTLLLENIEKVIAIMLNKCKIRQTFVLTEAEILTSLNLSHKLMPKYLTLLDLKAKIDSMPSYANFAHVRPAILIQMAQLMEYVLKQLEDAAKEKKSLLGKETMIESPQALKVITILKAKQKEIAAVMTLQEQLDLSFGSADTIEAIHHLVGNDHTALLPDDKFFALEKQQHFKLCEYEEKDIEAPKPIPSNEMTQWRHDYIEKLNGTKQELFPLTLARTNAWLQQNHCVREYNIRLRQNQIFPTQMMCLVNVTHRQQLQSHSLEIMTIIADDINEEKTPDLYRFFVTEYAERSKFLNINTLFTQRMREYLQRQVKQQVNFIYLLAGHDWRLLNGTEGPRRNFSSLTQLVRHLGKPYEEEMKAVTQLKKTLRDPLQLNRIEKYIDHLKLTRNNLLAEANTIANYWKDSLKSASSDVFCGIKELDDMLTEILADTKIQLRL